jgi:prepilin-type N-terminal cleavage/methylation domain-containing protein
MEERSRRGERGLTLVELLIVLVVALVGFGGLLAVHEIAVRGNLGAERGAEASEICEEMMEELRGMAVAEIEAAYTTITATAWPPISYHRGDAVGRAGVVFVRTVEAQKMPGAGFGSDLIWLRATVEWNERGGPPDRRVYLELLRTEEERL